MNGFIGIAGIINYLCDGKGYCGQTAENEKSHVSVRQIISGDT